jgi:ligand-binding SRPBCC domain-containing protein
MRHTFHSEQWLPYPLEQVFAFFASPQNLPRLMPPSQDARIEEAFLKPPPPRPPTDNPAHRTIAAGIGTRLIISFKPFPYAPIRAHWEAEITEFDWNRRFCDTQLNGPFAFWCHCHSVTPAIRPSSGNPISGTLLTDDIEYALPLGALGNVANSLFITRQLRKTFAYRRVRASELLAAS